MSESQVQAERDKRLDALKQAVEQWSDAELKRIDYEVDFLTSVLKGRTGSGRVVAKNQNSAKALFVESLKVFMEG